MVNLYLTHITLDSESLLSVRHRLTCTRSSSFINMSTGRISNCNPPSTDPKIIKSLWEEVTHHNMTPFPASNTTEEPNDSGSWNQYRREVLHDDYGVEVCNLVADDADTTTFDPPTEDVEDPYFFINKTDAELTELAEAGAIYLSTGASEATCTTWIAKLLPLSSKKMVCRNSELIFPRAIPKGIRPNPRSIPWTRIKPDAVWFNASRVLQSTARDTFCKVLGSTNKWYATVALNAEYKSTGGSVYVAQLQGIMTATIALSERISIREAAGQTKDISELSQYFFIFEPKDIQLWRLEKTTCGLFKARQMDLPTMNFSKVDGIRHFISVWNRLISNLTGPALRSLEHDLLQIAAKTRSIGTKRRAPTVQSTMKTRSKRTPKNI